MKGNKQQNEKDATKTKTKSPHSIGASVSTKILNVSKKSQPIKKQSDKPSSIQSKLVSIKNENGSKSLIVSKVSTPVKTQETRPAKSSSVVAAAQVELKKTVAKEQTRKSAKESKSPTASTSTKKSVSCKHCNLHFSNDTWLKKHISKCHAVELSLQVKTKTEPMKQVQPKPATKDVNEKVKKKSKLSPSKQQLRDQLKSQLAAQQKLLKVQQQIIERTNKAQQDISALLAKLGDDSDDDDLSEEDAAAAANIKLNAEDADYYENLENELIVPEEVGPGQPQYEIEEQLITDDNNYVVLNDQIAQEYQENNAHMSVMIASGNDEEEYELVEVVEDQIYDDQNAIQFEVVEDDQNSIHCRIVTNDEQEQMEEIEYVDVQIDQKLPVKVDVSEIQKIAQKRFIQPVDDTKILNTAINKPEKQTNEYIQKVVQNATPTEDNKFECPICHELVSNRYSLGPHILRLHSKQKSKICQYCDRSFTCTGDLTRHIRIHTGEKPFKCTYENCSYAFRASGDLHKHMRRHNSTTVNIRQHVCTECERAFERNYDLKRHELTHKKNEEGVGYTCEFCSKRFVRKDQHKSHVYRHLGIKQYKCPDCDRRFSDFSNCSKHIRQCEAGDVKLYGPDDDGPQYICEICNKRFKSKVGMRQHVVKCAQITELQKKLQESIQHMEDE